MGKSNVEIFLRVRPNFHNKPTSHSKVSADDKTVEFNLERDESGGYINNQKIHYEFNFNGVFDSSTRQETVFAHVAEKAVLSAVEGYNATIFAYGQTGSGKTWSITGGINKYDDRGIIPRSLSRCFQECQKSTDRTFQIKISYMEIYNETCYDLLDPKHEGTTLEDLPKVQIRESQKGKLKFTNLHKHLVNNEEEALNLLFLGDTNRMICETPMNKASSRSHCVFTVTNGAAFVRKSKFHLVDLAGSERISKTGVHGQIATEAKYINLSLHYLEQVIITLQENPKGHVPYRNSKVTSVLRDSLGGNCRTTMIATVNLDDEFSMESISTCKFAARVAMIANDANINEHTDPKIVIAGLRQQIDVLKAELRAAGKDADEPEVPLTMDDLAMIAEMVRTYVNDRSEDATLSIAEIRKVREAFTVFKGLVWESRESLMKKADIQQVEQLKGMLATRDHELAVLVKLLKKMESGRPGEGPPSAEVSGYTKSYSPRAYSADGNGMARPASTTTVNRATSSDVVSKRQQIANMIKEAEEEEESDTLIGKSLQMDIDKRAKTQPQSQLFSHSHPPATQNSHPQQQSQPTIPTKREAFEKFKLQHADYAPSQENHAVLKEKYTVAKEYSDQVTQAREKINGYIALIEQLRVERAMQGLVNKDKESKEKDKKDIEEDRTRGLVEKEKVRYKQLCDKLQQVKSEIDTLQALIKNTNTTIQKDFLSWYNAVYSNPSRSSTPAPILNNLTVTNMEDSPHSTPRSSPSPSPSPRGQLLNERPSRPSSPAHTPRSSSALSSSSSFSSSSSSSNGSQPILTGNKEADEEILKFWNARNNLRAKNK